jgi:hypothetical protein
MMAPTQVTQANTAHLIRQAQQAAKHQNHMQQTLMSGPSHIASAPTATQLAAATQGASLMNQLAAQTSYLQAHGTPRPAHVNYASQPVSGLSLSLEDTFASEASNMHSGLAAALGETDMARLEQNRLVNLLPKTAFASADEKAHQRALYRAAMEAAQCQPDSAVSYLGTISAAAPSLINTIRSVQRVNSIPLSGQPLYTPDRQLNVRQYLIPPTPVTRPSECSAVSNASDVLLKNRYMADQLGAQIFQGDYAGAFGPAGITQGVVTAAQLGQELLQ